MFWKSLASVTALVQVASCAPVLDSRQVGNPMPNCPQMEFTRLAEDPLPYQNYYWEQMSDNVNCDATGCSIEQSFVDTVTISATFAPGGEGWTGGSFGVSASRSMGETIGCPATDRRRVCMWYMMTHTGYQVQRFSRINVNNQCLSREIGDQFWIRSPNDLNSSPGGWHCRYDDDCNARGASYWEVDVCPGENPCE